MTTKEILACEEEHVVFTGGPGYRSEKSIACDWEISPAMAQQKIDSLNARVEQLETELAANAAMLRNKGAK